MIFVRRMTMDDLDAAVAVEEASFSRPWTREVFRATLLLPYARYYAAEEDGTVVGICGVRNIAGVGEISNVGVLPSFRGKGIATLMLRTLLEEGKREGIPEHTLEVRAGNEAAIALYRKFGFLTEGIRRDFYDAPKEDAWIMWRR